jgi:alpha-L-rhamnosidase
VLANLVAAVEKADGCIDTGILGAKYLLNALLENDRAGIAYRMVVQTNQPSWGWWLNQGATTLWEQWNGSESRNHIMFGDVSAWFYKAIGGIMPDLNSPGFKHFTIAPQVLGDLRWARTRYDSIRGPIVSDWKVVNGEFRIKVVIPANTTATVCLPVEAATLRSSVPVGSNTLKALAARRGRATLEAGPGTFEFSGTLLKW